MKRALTIIGLLAIPISASVLQWLLFELLSASSLAPWIRAALIAPFTVVVVLIMGAAGRALRLEVEKWKQR